jgi:alginate O-acetyltransferase complex protein AlgJ
VETGPRLRPPLPPTPEAWLPNQHSLYRPRHSPRQRAALSCAIAFFLVPTLAFVFGVRATSFENRPLHEFPSVSDGWGFFTGLSGWATDHLALRQAGVNTANGIGAGVFGDPPSVGQGTPLGPISGNAPGAPPPKGPDPHRYITYPPVVFGSDDWLYLGADVGNKCNATMDVDTLIARLQLLRTLVEQSGRRFELIVPPDKSTMVPEHLPASYAGKDCSLARTAEFWRRVPPATKMIDLRSELVKTATRVGHPIYDNYDTHWTYEGGVAMAYAFAERLNPGVTATWQTKPGATQTWPADIVMLLGTKKDRTLLRYSIAPDGTKDRSRYVASDFRTPLNLKQPDAGTPAIGVVTAKVGLIADSFTQFASPFLAAGISDLTIVHPETVAKNATENTANFLVDRDVIAVELAERNTAGGGSPLLDEQVIDDIGKVLAQNPR